MVSTLVAPSVLADAPAKETIPTRVVTLRPHAPMVVIDFETYFDSSYSLKKLSIAEYVGDRRFKVHGVAIGLPDGRNVFRTDAAQALAELQQSYGPRLEQAMVVMHNAYFDGAILSWKYGITPTNIVDTMLLSHHVYGPRADGGGEASVSALATRLGFQQKGRIEFLRGVKQLSRTRLDELSQYARNDVDLERKIASRLLPMVSSRSTELSIMAHSVRLFTEKSLRLDATRVKEARQLITDQLTQTLTGAGITEDDVSKDARFTDLLKAAMAATSRSLPTKPGKRGPIPAIAKDDEAMQALRADTDPAVRALVVARLAKKSADQTLARLNTMQSMANARGGRLAPKLNYYGTHTGRFSSSGGLNLQNMPSPGRQRTPEARAIALAVRRCIMADPGYKLVCADASQIEARILAYLAGQLDVLEAFATKRDLYSDFARDTLGVHVRKPTAVDSDAKAAELKAYRNIGKEAVLGLGYSMGVSTFVDRLKTAPDVAKLFTAGVLSIRTCANIVYGYRDRYPNIKNLWGEYEKALRSAVAGYSSTVGSVKFESLKQAVHVHLPSGRMLRYDEPKLVKRSEPIHYIDRKGEPATFESDEPVLVYGASGQSLYGGKLTENIVQAVARDVLVEAILNLERAGRPVILHVHDEIICHVPEAEAEQCRKDIEQQLTTPPTWAPGLVLDAEGVISDDLAKA